MTNCRNCREPLNGDYCSSCGQRNVNLDRPIWGLLGDIVKETIDLDGRAALTIKTLFRHPGTLTREFLAGRRSLYTPPLRLYLVTSIVFFVLVAWLAKIGLLLSTTQGADFDTEVQARFLSDILPKLMFVLLPVFALLLKFAYSRQLYFEHLIFSLHLHTVSYFVLVLMLPLEDLAGRHIVLVMAQVLLLVYFLAYFVFAIRRVYQSGWFATAWKSALVLFGYMIVVSIAIEGTSSFRIVSD